MKKLILGLLAALALVPPAVAQQQTLPASTVVGRLGVSPGPAQAIPFSTLGSLLVSTGSGVFGLKLSGDVDYAMTTLDRTVLINAALTASRTITLFAAATLANGQQICIADAFGGVTFTNTLTIARAGSDTVNGGTSTLVRGAFGGLCLISDGVSKWSYNVNPLAEGGTGSSLTAVNRAVFNTDANGVTALTSQPVLGVNGGTGGQITLNGATSGSVTTRVAAVAGTSTIFQYPATNGTINQALLTDGSGNTIWGIAANLTINVQRFTASGTYTPTVNIRYAIIECVGGGGSGAGGTGPATGFYVGGGGGSGSYSKAFASTATIGASQTVTIGPGGTAPAAGNNNGTTGTDTSVGALCVGKGGSGGLFASGAQVAQGGAGGVAGTGNIENPPGQFGQAGSFINVANVILYSGTGASSRLGPGANVSVQAGAGTTAAGVAAAANSGGGGSGGNANSTATTFAGGNGGSGLVLVTEFIQQ